MLYCALIKQLYFFPVKQVIHFQISSEFILLAERIESTLNLYARREMYLQKNRTVNNTHPL